MDKILKQELFSGYIILMMVVYILVNPFFFQMTRGAPGTAKLKDLDKHDMVKSEYKINFSISLRPDPMGKIK